MHDDRAIMRATRRRRRRTTGLAAVVALLCLATATGCGEAAPTPAVSAAPEPSAPATVRDRLVAQVAGAYASAEDLAEGGCFADALLAEVDEADVAESGVLDADNLDGMLPRPPKSMVEPWVDAQFACTDYVKQATRAQAFATNNQIDVLAYSACYGRQVDEAVARRALTFALRRSFENPVWKKVRAAERFCLGRSQLSP